MLHVLDHLIGLLSDLMPSPATSCVRPTRNGLPYLSCCDRSVCLFFVRPRVRVRSLAHVLDHTSPVHPRLLGSHQLYLSGCPVIDPLCMSQRHHLTSLPVCCVWLPPLLLRTRLRSAHCALLLSYCSSPSMSFCHISGFFTISCPTYVAMYDRFPTPDGPSAQNSPLPLFCHYKSSICAAGKEVACADIRAAEPLGQNRIPPKSIVWLVGTVYVQTGVPLSIIDADHLHVFPGDPSSPNYALSFPKLSASHLDAMGKLCGRMKVLTDGTKVFEISITQYIRDDIKSFRVACVLLPSSQSFTGAHFQNRCIVSRQSHLWYNTHLPPIGSAVHVNGLCSVLSPTGKLAVELDDVIFELGLGKLPAVKPRPRFTFHCKVSDGEQQLSDDEQDTAARDL